MNHYLVLILIIFCGGILGGLINYFRVSSEVSTIKFALGKSILTGLGASALVPLFLNTISSDLLSTSRTNNDDYFVIAGFCLISSIFSSKFIDSVGDRIIQDVKLVSKKVDQVKEELEDVTTEKELPDFSEDHFDFQRPDEQEMRVLESLNNSKYTYRSISGIAAETFLNKNGIEATLEKLESKDYVKRYIRTNGMIRWRLTERGREIVAATIGDESSPGF